MKTTEAKLLSFLQKSPQFIIPIYQRTHSCTDNQCRQLWDEILAIEKEAEGLLSEIVSGREA